MVTLAVGLCSVGGLIRAKNISRQFGNVLEILIMSTIVIPSVVMASGWVLLGSEYDFVATYFSIEAIMIFIYSVSAFPLMVQMLTPVAVAIDERFAKSMAILRVSPWQQWTRVRLPLMRFSIRAAFGLIVAAGVGELTAAAVVCDGTTETLALLLYRTMGSYRFGLSAVVSLVLVMMSCAMVYISETSQEKAERIWGSN